MQILEYWTRQLICCHHYFSFYNQLENINTLFLLLQFSVRMQKLQSRMFLQQPLISSDAPMSFAILSTLH